MRELKLNESMEISGGLNNGGYGFTNIVSTTATGALVGLFFGSIQGGAILGCGYGSAMFLAKTLDALIFDAPNSQPHEITYVVTEEV